MEGGGWSVCTIEVGGPAKIELRWSAWGKHEFLCVGGRPVEKLMRNEDRKGDASKTWMVATQIFLECSPRKFGEDEPILTNIFQLGWFNHQLEN